MLAEQVKGQPGHFMVPQQQVIDAQEHCLGTKQVLTIINVHTLN